MVKRLFEKAFLSGYYFTIAMRRRTEGGILQDDSFRSEYVFPAKLKDWAADPVLVDDADRTYLFYEAVKGEKGRIEVVEVYEDCSVSSPVVILEDGYHYSYPFVFNHKGKWYMIPESSSQQEVVLYQATDFPYQWKPAALLLSGFPAVDTSVFSHNGDMYLLTYVPNPPTEQVTPKAYRMDFDESVCLTEIPWKNFDPLRSRGAGAIFTYADMMYRPAQVNETYRYGNALAFYEVNPEKSVYSETERYEITPSKLTIPNVRFDGLHTYAVSARFEAIDIRCRDIDIYKIFRKVWKKLFRRN